MAYYIISQADMDAGKFEILSGDSIITSSYFHPVDIDIVRDQIDITTHPTGNPPPRPSVFGFQILPAVILLNGNLVKTNILLAVVERDNGGRVKKSLNKAGNIIALSCPPFTDTHGGRRYKI